MPTSAAAPTSARRSVLDRTPFRFVNSESENGHGEPCDDVLVACPDARTPAYQAVVGLARDGRLGRFRDCFLLCRRRPAFETSARRVAPRRFARHERLLLRRQEPEIPRGRVRSDWGFDVALAAEVPSGSKPAESSVASSPAGGPGGSTGSSSGSWFAIGPGRPFSSATWPRNLACRPVGGWASRRYCPWCTATCVKSGG